MPLSCVHVYMSAVYVCVHEKKIEDIKSKHVRRRRKKNPRVAEYAAAGTIAKILLENNRTEWKKRA